MKYSLLEMVQRILGSMESDEVSSINETQEAQDIVGIIKECYFDLVGMNNLAEHEGIFRLDASTDNLKPTLMYVPANVVRVDWLKYDHGTGSPDYTPLHYVDNEEFLYLQGGIDQADPETGTMTTPVNGVNMTFRFRNDRRPTYYTIFDERHVIFDSYDAAQSITLMSARTVGHGLLSPEFVAVDSFVPDLDHRQFQLLLQDAKATAHIELKQQPNPKAEQKLRRNQILAQKTKNDNDPSSTRQAVYRTGRQRRY
jgi:hypothetical protein